MRLTDLWRESQKPTLSFELFPARTEKAAERLNNTIDVLASLNPDFASITFGAGGSTRTGSHQLLEKLIQEKRLRTVGYFACYGLSPDEISAVLDSYRELGIKNILLVRGDIPREEEDFSPHPDSFAHASQLVEFVRPRYDFCLGVAAYPEGHIEAESKEKDLEYLKLKIDNGAEYIITNYAYDNQYFYQFRDRCREIGIEVPILPGVMPIYSLKMMASLANLCGASIPDKLQQRLNELPEDDKGAVLRFGIEFAFQQCRDLLSEGVPGIHIYTMDRFKSVAEIVNRLRSEGHL